MQFHRQLNRHVPALGEIGDCFRTCIACFLNLHPSDVPHFSGIHYDGNPFESKAQNEHVQSWLAERGLTLINIAYGDQPVEYLTETIRMTNGDDFCYMLSGSGSTGHGHVAIYRGNALLWCPSGDKGVVGPHASTGNDDPAMYWVKFFGSMRCRFTPEEDR